MKEIQLTQGKVALVDDEDFEYLNQFKWCLARRGKTNYAKRNDKAMGMVYMHRIIVNPEESQLIDHIDGNGLNNQRSNLRTCNHSENRRNIYLRSNNTSGYKGVSLRKDRKKWIAKIENNGRTKYLGGFDDAENAARCYDEAAKKYFGEFAKLNFPEK